MCSPVFVLTHCFEHFLLQLLNQRLNTAHYLLLNYCSCTKIILRLLLMLCYFTEQVYTLLA